MGSAVPGEQDTSYRPMSGVCCFAGRNIQRHASREAPRGVALMTAPCGKQARMRQRPSTKLPWFEQQGAAAICPSSRLGNVLDDEDDTPCQLRHL
jgi:hypothetical protein